jgi:hypothetical protein
MKKNKDLMYFQSGSQSLSYILDALIKDKKINKIFIPNFICDDVTKIISKKSILTQYYKVTPKLQINTKTDLISKIDKKSALLIVNFFGFPANWEYIKSIADEKKCIVLEDNCHTLNSQYLGKNLGEFGDISFNSLRKVLPVLSGSVIQSNSSLFKTKKTSAIFPNLNQILYSLRAYKRTTTKKTVYSDMPISNKSNIDYFSKIIYSNYNLENKSIRHIRIKNFKFWNQFIKKTDLNGIIELNSLNNVTPYAFPCMSRDPKYLQKWINWGVKNNINIIRWPAFPKDININLMDDNLANILLFPVNHQYLLSESDLKCP